MHAAGITVETRSDGIARGSLPGCVCLSGGRIVGYCFGARDAREVLVPALLPEYEGKGIGKTLSGMMIEHFTNRGFDRLFLGCSADPRTRSYGFYRHLGWRSTGTFDAAQYEVLEYFVTREATARTE